MIKFLAKLDDDNYGFDTSTLAKIGYKDKDQILFKAQISPPRLFVRVYNEETDGMFNPSPVDKDFAKGCLAAAAIWFSEDNPEAVYLNPEPVRTKTIQDFEERDDLVDTDWYELSITNQSNVSE